jgi:transcriptional antiterminator
MNLLHEKWGICLVHEEDYKVVKPLNNNVVFAEDKEGKEVVLVGKGIGFQVKRGSFIKPGGFEKVFQLTEQKTAQYRQMLDQVEDEVIGVCEEFIYFVSQHLNELNEHLHIALIDHLAFAIRRLQKGMIVDNPFLQEIKVMYPLEYALAEKGAKMFEEELDVRLPEAEIGFITLHLHSARSSQDIGKTKKSTMLINKLTEIIEAELQLKIDKQSINYARLITHLRFAIERAQTGQTLSESHPLSSLLQKEYPRCYNLAWKLVKVMQKEVMKPISDAEISYLTLHLQRIASQNEY